MQAHLLEPEKAEYGEKVAALTHNIGLTDYGVGPHPADFEKERRHLLAEKLKAGDRWGAADWAPDEAPSAWYRRPSEEVGPLSLPYTALHALELAIHTHHMDARVLTKGRLILHVAGATSEHEGASDFKVRRQTRLSQAHIISCMHRLTPATHPTHPHPHNPLHRSSSTSCPSWRSSTSCTSASSASSGPARPSSPTRRPRPRGRWCPRRPAWARAGGWWSARYAGWQERQAGGWLLDGVGCCWGTWMWVGVGRRGWVTDLEIR